jgi:hypothetical protein
MQMSANSAIHKYNSRIETGQQLLCCDKERVKWDKWCSSCPQPAVRHSLLAMTSTQAKTAPGVLAAYAATHVRAWTFRSKLFVSAPHQPLQKYSTPVLRFPLDDRPTTHQRPRNLQALEPQNSRISTSICQSKKRESQTQRRHHV